MSKELEITLSDEWYRWVEDEAIHRGQSESELFEDALAAFLAQLQADVQKLQDDAVGRTSFCSALEGIFNDNHRARRRIWNNPHIYLALNERHQCCTTWNSDTKSVDGVLHPWIMSDEDYFSTDWEIIDA